MQLYLEIVGKDKLNKHKMSELARMIRFAVNDDYDTILYGGYDPTIVSSRVLEDDEIHKLLDSFHVDSKWIFSRLGSGEFRYPVYVELDETLDYMYWGETADVSIVVGEQRPVELLWTE